MKLSSGLQPKYFSGILFFLLLIQGCGYTHQATLPQNIKTIYVDTVKNKIPTENTYAYQPGLEIDITNAVIKGLQRDGNLKVVPREQADAVLQADLIGFEHEGLRFSSLESVEEYRLYIVLNVVLKDNKTQQIIWQESNFSGDAEYVVTPVRSLGRQEAAERAVSRLAKNVVDRIVEDW